MINTQYLIKGTVKPVLSDHPFRWHGNHKTGGCLLLHESSAEIQPKTNHLSENKNMSCFIWLLNKGLTVFGDNCRLNNSP